MTKEEIAAILREEIFAEDPELVDAFYAEAISDAAERLAELVDKEHTANRIKASHSLANNLCGDHRDKQASKPCLACEIERLEKTRQ